MEETQDQFSMKCPLFRENLWLREFGEVFYAKCPTPLCNVKISPFNFDVGHITAASKGGKVTFDNCRPICARCNRCNGTRNMDEFFERTNAMERYLYDDQPYEVECIKDSKKCKGKTFYLIKWEGFNEKYNTWEPKDNLEHPPSEYTWETEKRVLRSNSKNV